MDKDKQTDTVEPSFDNLKQASHDLKDKIEELKRKTAMPVNSSLGDPATDAANADGRHDLPPDDDD
jgi:hypothetical protein